MEERGLKHQDIWPVPGNKGAATHRSGVGRTHASCPYAC